jgi:U3 small nucleolar RNA-associated protein 18
MADYTSSDAEMVEEDDIPEKDDVEERLEKLLFGDDEGFQAALKSHGPQGTTDLVLASDQEDGEGENEDEQNMDDVADADVSFVYTVLDVTFFIDEIVSIALFPRLRRARTTRCS